MIDAKVVADSISSSGIRLTTMELCFHRFILPEFNTHRVFSRNAASSRAIPTNKLLSQVADSPAMPVHWGKNQPGMQAREECNNEVWLDWDDYNDCERRGTREEAWIEASLHAIETAKSLDFAGYHKQVTNRLLEPFMWVKVIVTATEWDNFFSLRLHKDAQPEMALLASKMREALEQSNPVTLQPGQWYLPYVTGDTWEDVKEDVTSAIKCSVARCARVSYLNHDNSQPDIAKDISLADKLLEAGHMSPFEHQGTPMVYSKAYYNICLLKGETHLDKNGHKWSGNFRGWVQYRQLLGAT